jgi:hypothetical protein
VPRYLVDRDFGRISEDEMLEVAARLKATGAEHFPDIVWEGTNVCAGDGGGIRAFCVYTAPSEERIREHTATVRGLSVERIYEIAGDITPADVTV